MKHLLIAAAFAASTTSPTVMAAVYASASLSNIQFKVVDLDLTDGIDASVAFAPFYTALFADNSSGSDFDFETPLNSLTSVSVNNGVITASASSLYGADYGLNLQASGSLTGKINFDYNVFQSFTSDYQQFTLSPMTRLEVTADSNMFVSTNDIFEYSYASHYFYATDSFFNQYTSNGGNIRTQILVDYNNPKFLSEVKSLSYFIENLTSQQLSGNYSHQTETYGRILNDPSAVPIPAALPLMASALGIFGIARRRNKSKAA